MAQGMLGKESGTRMNVNSFQDRENAIIDQALPSNRPSITKQKTKYYQAIDHLSKYYSKY